MKNLILTLLICFSLISCRQNNNQSTEQKNEKVKMQTCVDYDYETVEYPKDSEEYWRYPKDGNTKLAKRFFKFVIANYLAQLKCENTYKTKYMPMDIDRISQEIVDTLTVLKYNTGVYMLEGGKLFEPKGDSYEDLEKRVVINDSGNDILNILNFVRNNVGIVRFRNNGASVPHYIIEEKSNATIFNLTIDREVYDGNFDPDEVLYDDGEGSGDFYGDVWYITNI